MLLADRVRTSLEQSFSLIAVFVLQAGKHADITGLQLVGGVRGEVTEQDVVLETKHLGFEGLMAPEAVTDQHPWLLVSLPSGLGIKHALEPL
jgi:hypothetical protein